jgi:hypothetical protein
MARRASLSMAPYSFLRAPGLMAPLYNYRAPTIAYVQDV